MKRRTRAIVATVAGGGLATCAFALYLAEGEGHELLLMMLFNLSLSGTICGVLIWSLGKVITPVDQAYRIGYQTGYEDGRRKDKPLVIDATTEFARRARAQTHAN